METFFRVALIILLVASVLTIFTSFAEGAFPFIVAVISAIFGIFVIVVAFKIGSPWYIIVALFVSELCFVISAIPFEGEVHAGLFAGIVSALAMAFDVAMTFIK